jgi:hypothetical protein
VLKLRAAPDRSESAIGAPRGLTLRLQNLRFVAEIDGEVSLRNLILAGTASLSIILGVGAARADYLVYPYRPAIDAIGESEPPAIEGVAALPDGAEFSPSLPSSRGQVVIEDSATTPTTLLHLRHRRILVIGR